MVFEEMKVVPTETVIECGTFTIKTDGTKQNTHLLMDGKPMKGVHRVLLDLNCSGKEFFDCKITLGVHPR